MSISKTAGTKFFVSPTTLLPDNINDMSDAAAIAYFEAINDWIEVEEVEEYGEIGDAAQSITFTAVGNRRVRKLKGPRDAGIQNLVVGRDPLDDGQDQMILSEKEDWNYPFRIILADQPDASYGPSVMYYGGLVMNRPTNIGNVMSVTRRTFSIAINTALYEVLAEALAVPVNVLRPSISGASVQTGVLLTADVGTWTNVPSSFTYQWQADDAGNGAYANIGGATASTFTPVAGNVGDSLRVQVVAVNGAGNSATANSVGTSLQVAA